jgi:hypothetical protein
MGTCGLLATSSEKPPNLMFVRVNFSPNEVCFPAAIFEIFCLGENPCAIIAQGF